MDGLIVKGIGGFYYVKDDYGNVTQCRARGSFKNEGITPCVGDKVRYEILEDKDGIVEEIYPRKNIFIRPPIANVDLLVIVVSATKPKPNMFIIDRFLVMAEKSNTDILLCINKVDNAKEKDIESLKDIYGNIYKMVFTSGVSKEGLDELKDLLKDKKTAFAGPSGVGKSSLINLLIPEANMETGKVSSKTARGKHTTRHVEMFESHGGYVFDTPGFTSFDILDVEEDELADYYPEIAKYSGGCRFDNCRHIKEPDCAVIEAVEEGKISQARYKSYVSNIEEIRKRKKY